MMGGIVTPFFGNTCFSVIPRVSENMPLYDILNEFQKGHSHIAVVYRDLKEMKGVPKNTKGESF